jgi:hypothetical protein
MIAEVGLDDLDVVLRLDPGADHVGLGAGRERSRDQPVLKRLRIVM